MSLSERLRKAAIERAQQSGAPIDDPTGVIDLRESNPQLPTSSTVPESILAGGPPSAIQPTGNAVTSPVNEPTPLFTEVARMTASAAPSDPLFHEQNAANAPCLRCGVFVERHMLDVFTGTEYYSCGDCGHMWQQGTRT